MSDDTATDEQPDGPPLGLSLHDQLGLVERLRDMSRRGHWPLLGDEAADEIERLRAALAAVRQHPDFDDGGPLAEMMDQVLRGDPAPMLDKLADWAHIYGPGA